MKSHHVEYFGIEREPVIVIDDFTGRIAEFIAAGRRARYETVTGYPGLRCPLNPTYLAIGEPLLGHLLSNHFGLTKRFRAESCSFSVVSVPPDKLTPSQRRPHYDGPAPNLVAIVHFTQGVGTGGTAFYRHRRTGFEVITPDRVTAYNQAVGEDDAELGAFAAAYYHGDSDRYEMIGEIEPRPDRLIAYRGRQLHSGVIPAPPDATTTPATGRLTINTFLIGEL